MNRPNRPKKSGPRIIDAPSLVEDFRERELSRRRILQGALAGSAVLLSGQLAGCSQETDISVVSIGRSDMGAGGAGGAGGAAADPDAAVQADMANREPDESVEDASPPDATPVTSGHLVGMGWSEGDYMQALDRAFAESMDLSFIGQGDTVYFKVNCNNGDLYPHSTKPELIVELSRRCRDHGASRIIVGDRSFWGDPNTHSNMRANGVAGAAQQAEAELLIFDDDAVNWLDVSQQRASDWNGGFRLPVPVTEADHIINLPCMKTHFISDFTMALKNMIGLVNPIDRRREGNLDVHRVPKLYRQIGQINREITPSLNILDGFEALITGGPTIDSPPGATYAEPHVIVVSADRVATDVTGIAVLQTLSPESENVTRHAAWAHPQIQESIRYCGGISNASEYDLSGTTVPEIERYRANAVRG